MANFSSHYFSNFYFVHTQYTFVLYKLLHYCIAKHICHQTSSLAKLRRRASRLSETRTDVVSSALWGRRLRLKKVMPSDGNSKSIQLANLDYSIRLAP